MRDVEASGERVEPGHSLGQLCVRVGLCPAPGPLGYVLLVRGAHHLGQAFAKRCDRRLEFGGHPRDVQV